VFILPFVLARIFRPTFLDVFNLTNLELGTCFSVYGIVAFVSYLFGGMVADRFQPRFLIALALVLTALGGFYLATYPSYFMMKVLWGYWGFTTIFLFWAALIKATRIWGGPQRQGLAFGFLDGGRGLVAAAFGSLGVLVFSLFISSELDVNSLAERKEAFKYVILVSSGLVVFIALLVLFFLSSRSKEPTLIEKSFTIHSMANFSTVFRIPSVWLLMIIILCAYVGYKTTDVFSLYAREVMGYTEIESAQVGNFLLYIRPVIGVLIGLLADKTRTSLMMVLGFVIMIIGSLIFASGVIDPDMNLLFLFSILITATGVYAFRTLYFAALQEGQIPLAVTGTAVGLISLIGYTPDIFAGPAMGYLLDNSPGEPGHQHVFLMLAAFALIGFMAAFRFMKLGKKQI
jgi:sugar phosphate permease